MMVRTSKPPTYDDLKATVELLRCDLIDCRVVRTEGEALVNATIAIRAKALALAEAHEIHPWTHQKVYDAGRALVKAVREEM